MSLIVSARWTCSIASETIDSLELLRPPRPRGSLLSPRKAGSLTSPQKSRNGCEAKSEKGGNIGVRFKSPKRYQKGGQKSGGGNKRVIYSWTKNPPKMACLEKVRPIISWEAGNACLQMAISSFDHPISLNLIHLISLQEYLK